MAGDPEIKQDVNRGLAWIGLASSLVGVLDFVAILVLLAFWITPEQYGTATLAVAAFPILDQLTDLGLSAAVIQRSVPSMRVAIRGSICDATLAGSGRCEA